LSSIRSTFGAAAVQPGVGEVVPEPVRIHGQPALPAAAGDGLVDAGRGQRPRLFTPSHSCGRQACGCRARARRERSRLRAA
jgi:hypothetical protein